MAAAQSFTISQFLLCFFLFMTLFSATAEGTKLTVYLQDFAFGPNATLVPVAGIPGKNRTFTQFGTVFVTDDFVTEGPDLNSPAVGRAQGIYVNTDLRGNNLLVILSLVFTNKKFNGSTIEIQGISKQFDPVRELSVISGTGKFRDVRGYAQSETYYFNLTTGYTIIKLTLALKF